MKPFAIAGLQLDLLAAGDNLPRMEQKLNHLMALYPWVQMVVFSELAACGPSPRKAEPMPGPAERAFQAMAARHGVWLLSGSHFELVDDRVFNTCSVIDPHGRVVHRYRKLFPFRPYEIGVEAGSSFVTFDVPGAGRFGVSICYDMWFPETSRTLAALGAEVILHPSMTTTIDRDVELAMARATAAQNQCFVIDINGAGGAGNGRSIIVGPSGDVLHQAGHVEELLPLEIDLERVRRERETGLRGGLGQPLKSFRDSAVRFPVYGDDAAARAGLAGLGPLRRAERASPAGLDGAAAAGSPAPNRRPEDNAAAAADPAPAGPPATVGPSPRRSPRKRV